METRKRWVDITGLLVGTIRVDAFAREQTIKAAKWWVHCERCGEQKLMDGRALRLARKLGHYATGCWSCGTPRVTHGHSRGGRRSRPLSIWTGMMERCYSPSKKCYQHYGGRGIKVCDEWHSFDRFLADMGEPPAGLSIERIDNDGPYCKSNCRWATHREQVRNSRRNVFVESGGKRLCISEWAELAGVKYNAMYMHIKRGGDPDHLARAAAMRRNG